MQALLVWSPHSKGKYSESRRQIATAAGKLEHSRFGDTSDSALSDDLRHRIDWKWLANALETAESGGIHSCTLWAGYGGGATLCTLTRSATSSLSWSDESESSYSHRLNHGTSTLMHVTTSRTPTRKSTLRMQRAPMRRGPFPIALTCKRPRVHLGAWRRAVAAIVLLALRPPARRRPAKPLGQLLVWSKGGWLDNHGRQGEHGEEEPRVNCCWRRLQG